MIKNNQKYLNALQYVIDVLVMVVSLLLAYYVKFESPLSDPTAQHLGFQRYMAYLVVLVPVMMVGYLFNGLYNPQRKNRFYKEVVMILRSIVMSGFAILSILYVAKEVHYSREVLALFMLFTFGLMTLERGGIRYLLRTFRKKGYNLKHIVIIGVTDMGMNFAHKIIDNPTLGYNILGFLDDVTRRKKVLKYPVLGEIKSLEDLIKAEQIDEVIIALPIDAYNKVSRIVNLCEYNGIKAQIIPAYQSFLPAKPYFDNLEEIPLITVRHVPLEQPLNAFIKRFLDFVIALGVIVVLSPLLVILAVGVKLSSPGPIIFKQERVGRNRKSFMMYKFRSMKMQTEEDEKAAWTSKHDPRKTAFGTFIRKTSLDELPQFFNVLKGQMSIIGPRPERPYFVEQFKDEIPKYMVKHHVRPGITGWAQVNGWRGDTSIKKRIEHDIYYIENWTLGLDIQIFFMTIFVGFVNKNAY